MIYKILSGRALFITHLTGWALLALLFFTLFSNLRGIEEGLARTAVNLAFLPAIFYLNAKVLVNRFFEKERYLAWAGLLLLLWFGMAAFRAWVEIRVFGGGILAQQPPVDGGFRLFLGYLLAFFLLLLFSALYQLLENRRNLEMANRELASRHAEAQLNYLKAQMNPHFLFNTLNNIYAAASVQHPYTAAMVLRLSELLRYVTYDAQQQETLLYKEMDQIKGFLDLIRMKAPHPPKIDLDIDDGAPERRIEPMLLLPLVENAQKHGDLEDNANAFLRIRLKNEARRMLFEIENTYDPANRQKDAVGGVGLDNIRRRLALNYRGKHRFETSEANGVFKVVLEILSP